MFKGGFVAKASSFNPRPSLLYFEAKINRRNVLCLVDLGVTHSLASLKLAKKLGLLTDRADKTINMQFVKTKPHETKEVALHVT